MRPKTPTKPPNTEHDKHNRILAALQAAGYTVQRRAGFAVAIVPAANRKAA